MRVIHVITRLIVGGAQENTVASVLGLHRRPPLHVELLSGPPEGPEGSLVRAFTGPEPALTILPALTRPLHPWKDVQAWRHLTRIFRERRPTIVHTHSGKAGFLGRLAAARAGVPVILHTIHGPSFGPFQGPLANQLFLRAEQYAGRVTSHFVSVAEAMTRQYLEAGIGRPEQFTRIVSGFDLAPYLAADNDPARRTRLGLAPADLVIGVIARLFKLKGHDDLLDIAPALIHHCPNLKFLLVGGGPWRGRLEARVRSMGISDRFVFTGLVDPAEVPGLLGIMDIVAHLSRREGLPRAVSQALAAARPVVAYDCDGAREVCLEGETGFLVQPGDLPALTTRLLQLANDPALRERLGSRGRQLVREEFGLERMIDQLYHLYVRLAAEKATPAP
jgi:glycosyltransferase involved in cell wall biosynthesis